MKKLIATLLAMTMLFGVAGCSKKEEETEKTNKTKSEETEDTEDPDETKDTEDTKDTSAENTAASESDTPTETTAAQGGNLLAYTETEKHTLRHEPYDITMEYEIPILNGFTIRQNSTENYFSTYSEDSFTYKSDDEAIKNVEIYHIHLYTFAEEDIGFSYTESDNYEHVTSDNGYTISYNLKEDENENKPEEGPKWEIIAGVSGEVYRDAVILSNFRFVAFQSDVSEQDFVDFCLAIMNSVQYTHFDPDALYTDDERFELYTHNILIPLRGTVAGGDFDFDLGTSQGYPVARVNFNDDDLTYTMKTDILSSGSMMWENRVGNTDKYTPCTIAGYDALVNAGVGASIKYEFTIKLNDDHVEVVTLSASTFSDGSTSRDGVRFSDYQKEMMDESHAPDTIKLFGDYVSQFVSTWEVMDA